MLFNSSGVSINLAHSHNFSNNYIWPFSVAICQVVFSYPSLPKNMLFNSSGVVTYLAHSHCYSNNTNCPFSDAMCQAVLSYPSLPKNMLFNSSGVSTCLLNPTVSVINLFGPPLMLCTRRYSHIHLF